MSQTVKYLKKTTTKVYSTRSKNNVVLELLWGDQITLLSNTKKNGCYNVNTRWAKDVYVKASDFGDEPLLELYFIDVGQGDGVLMVTPDRRHMLIDGGYARIKQPHGKSAADFVDWKFFVEYNKTKIELDDVICSHCDADHYGGLWDLINEEHKEELDTDSITFKNFYHAGVAWWKDAANKRYLGKVKNEHLINLITGITSIKNGLKSNASLKLQGEWADFLKCLVDNTDASIKRLGHDPKGDFEYLPNYEVDKDVAIKILGPIEKTIGGKPAVKDFKTKSQNTNGNSVLLRVDYGNARILLTGDLNKQSQRHILDSLVGNTDELAADVVKSCHHGSDDCSYEFMQWVQAAVTVISSGDDNTHAHPRPNIVATAGTTGYKTLLDDELITPLVYSTEISRNVRIGDPIKVNYKDYETPDGNIDVELDVESKIKVTYERTKSGAIRATTKVKSMNRLKVVDGIVYGLVNVRTDGEKIVCATLNEGKSSWVINSFKARF